MSVLPNALAVAGSAFLNETMRNASRFQRPLLVINRRSMTRRSILSATFAIGGDDWRAGAFAIVAVGVAFTLYCQAHGWVEESPVPVDASLRWGLLAGAPAGGVAWLLWLQRRELAAFAARGTLTAASVISGLFILVLGGGALAHFVAGENRFDDIAARIVDSAFDLIPLAAALAAGAAALLAAIPRAHPSAETAVHIPEWLTIPEAPDLGLRTADVATIRAAGNYCELQTNVRCYLVRAPIKVLAERLGPAGFVRLHRSTLVNLGRLLAVDRAAGQIRARLDDGTIVPVGQAYRAGLEEALAARSSLRDAIRH